MNICEPTKLVFYGNKSGLLRIVATEEYDGTISGLAIALSDLNNSMPAGMTSNTVRTDEKFYDDDDDHDLVVVTWERDLTLKECQMEAAAIEAREEIRKGIQDKLRPNINAGLKGEYASQWNEITPDEDEHKSKQGNE